MPNSSKSAYAGNNFVTGRHASSMSLKLVQCSNSTNEIHTTSCYNTSSEWTCFTTFKTKDHLPMRMSFENASDWCKEKVPGSSLIVIKSAEDQRIVECFIEIQAFKNETIIIDARKLSTSESLKWSWVNGHQISPNVTGDNRLTAVALNFQQNSPAYLLLNDMSSSRYICEFSDSRPTFSYKQNNKSYVAYNTTATWYDARKECLRLGGDLASITDFQTIGNWSWLNINYGYWIGLHRNMWIWNSTGDAITYTYWEGGYPNESSDKQCICINPPQCNRTICDHERKWRTCNCNLSYAIVCQKQEDSDVSTTVIVVPEEMLPSTSADYTTTIIGDNTIGEIDGKNASSSSLTQDSSNHFVEIQTPALESLSTGIFITKEILLILLLLVAVAFISAAVIVIIRKRKYDRSNREAYMQNTAQSEAVSSVYTTVVPVNSRPSEGTLPPDNTIYAEVEMTQQQTPPSNNAIYASVQPTSETVDMGKNVDYANLDFPQKDQQKPRSVDKINACLSPIYSEPNELPTSASYTEYAEAFKPDN